jgi:hypothetical protein
VIGFIAPVWTLEFSTEARAFETAWSEATCPLTGAPVPVKDITTTPATLTFTIEESSFSAARLTILEGTVVKQWSNVAGSSIQGLANLAITTTRDSTITAAVGNGVNEIAARSAAEMAALCDNSCIGYAPTTVHLVEVDTNNDGVNDNCEVDFLERDVFILYQFSSAMDDDVDSGLNAFGNSTPASFQNVLGHELGHAIGFGHSDALLALMNRRPPNGGNPGGDPGGVFRIGWDEAKGLRSKLSSAGVYSANALLSKFRARTTSPPANNPQSFETWRSAADVKDEIDEMGEFEYWSSCPLYAVNSLSSARLDWGGCAGADPDGVCDRFGPPLGPTLYGYTTSPGGTSVTIVWKLVATPGDCPSGGYEIGRETYPLVGQPTLTFPKTWTPSVVVGFEGYGYEDAHWCIGDIPDGAYHVCAYVDEEYNSADPADPRSIDSIVVSDRKFTITDACAVECTYDTVFCHPCD